MINFQKLIISCATALAFLSQGVAEAAPAAATTMTTAPKIGVVNFKEVVEKSKIGKHEQKTFEAMREQMEKIVAEKEKALNDLGSKLQDEDYLDGLTPNAEKEIKHQYRMAAQELQQIQSQFMQTLQQANYKILQTISEKVAQASAKVAEKLGLDAVINNESVFYNNAKLNVSDQIVEEVDRQFDLDTKETPKEDAPKKGAA